MREDVRNILNRLLVGVYVVGAGALIWLLVWFGYSRWHSELSSYFAEHWHITGQSWPSLWIWGIAALGAAGLIILTMFTGIVLVLYLLDRIWESDAVF